MRAVVQRVERSKVTIDEKIVGQIEKGLNVLVGFTHEDTEKDIVYLSDKIANLRIFEDKEGKMNLSLKDIGGSILAVSQFTLYGDVKKGKRPSFIEAAAYQYAEKLYDLFILKIREMDINVQTGIYGADMRVEIINDGPVTILLDSEKKF